MKTSSLHLELLWEADGSPPPDLNLEAFIHALFAQLGRDHLELAILITSDAKVTRLNDQFRNKNRVTDVLSFPAGDVMADETHVLLGDIVISAQQAARQATELGQSLAMELRFLCLHGVLHLLGYDHETDNGEMLTLQGQLKDSLISFF